MESEEYGEGKQGLMIENIPYHLENMVEAANGSGSLGFADDVTADGSSKMTSGIYRAIVSVQIQVLQKW